jgi:hypothetical protein
MLKVIKSDRKCLEVWKFACEREYEEFVGRRVVLEEEEEETRICVDEFFVCWFPLNDAFLKERATFGSFQIWPRKSTHGFQLSFVYGHGFKPRTSPLSYFYRSLVAHVPFQACIQWSRVEIRFSRGGWDPGSFFCLRLPFQWVRPTISFRLLSVTWGPIRSSHVRPRSAAYVYIVSPLPYLEGHAPIYP